MLLSCFRDFPSRPNLTIILGFYINLPIGGLVAVVLFFVNIPRQMPKPKALSVLRTLPTTLDLIGFAIFAPAAIQLLLAIQYGGNQFAWNSPTVIGLFCGAGGTFIIFLGWDYFRGDAAMIPLSMICKKTVSFSCLVYGLLMSQMFTASYYLPIYFQGVKGVSPTLSGVHILPLILSQLSCAIGSGTLGGYRYHPDVVTFTDGQVVGKLGYYIPVSLCSAVLIAVGHGLLSTLAPGTSTGKWIGFQILLGAGSGSGLQMVGFTLSIVNLRIQLRPLTVCADCSRLSPSKTLSHPSRYPLQWP